MHLVAENGHSVCLKWLIDAGAGVGPLTKVSQPNVLMELIMGVRGKGSTLIAVDLDQCLLRQK